MSLWITQGQYYTSNVVPEDKIVGLNAEMVKQFLLGSKSDYAFIFNKVTFMFFVEF